MGYGIYPEQANATAINQGLEGQLYQCPWCTTTVTHTKKDTRVLIQTVRHKNRTKPPPSIQTIPHFQGKEPCVNRHPPQTSIFTLRLKLGRSEWSRMNTSLTQSHTRGPGDGTHFCPAGSCKLLLNNHGSN